MGKTPTTLIIMDGFGLTRPGPGNAVSLANTPVLDRLWADYAHTTLSASGLDVGLPEGQMGNSEVGHTNIGGGRVVFQDLPRISRAIDSGEFFKNPAYNKAMDDCLQKGSSLHLYGLLSDGGVHSTVEHLWALLKMAKEKGLEKEVKVVRTCCFGLCEAGPVVIIYPEGTFYSRVKVEDVDEIVSEHLLKGRKVQHLVYVDHVTHESTVTKSLCKSN